MFLKINIKIWFSLCPLCLVKRREEQKSDLYENQHGFKWKIEQLMTLNTSRAFESQSDNNPKNNRFPKYLIFRFTLNNTSPDILDKRTQNMMKWPIKYLILMDFVTKFMSFDENKFWKLYSRYVKRWTNLVQSALWKTGVKLNALCYNRVKFKMKLASFSHLFLARRPV